MGREVRMVPADWVHPKADNEYIPLFKGGDFADADAEWAEGFTKWQDGLCKQYGKTEKWGPIEEKYRHMRYTDYAGLRPSPDDYMPDWPVENRTHFMMYENTSEGTPISPAFATPEELARWLSDTSASAFAGDTASYEQWLVVCKRGFAPSMVVENGIVISGVEFSGRQANQEQPK